MVSTSFEMYHHDHIDINSLWSISQIIIGFGTVACMCCVVFLGLKLKWFRAQYNVQREPKNKKSADTVQGIGFKIKSNPEQFQRYKIISEFSTTPTNITKIGTNTSDTNNTNHFDKVIKREDLDINEKELVSINIKKKDSLGLSKESIQVEEKKQKVTFAENETVEEIRNSLTQENEDEDEYNNWQIRIVDDKSKKKKIDADSYYEEIHEKNNESNSMYSSEAASIFFESYNEPQVQVQAQPPDSPPPPIPRKFFEHYDDTISISSQTSA